MSEELKDHIKKVSKIELHFHFEGAFSKDALFYHKNITLLYLIMISSIFLIYLIFLLLFELGNIKIH